MNPLIEVLLMILDLFKWSLIIYVLISVLIQFGIVNRYNSIVNMIQSSLAQIHEPILQKLRKFIPIFGSLDITPIVVFMLIHLLSGFLRNITYY